MLPFGFFLIPLFDKLMPNEIRYDYWVGVNVYPNILDEKKRIKRERKEKDNLLHQNRRLWRKALSLGGLDNCDMFCQYYVGWITNFWLGRQNMVRFKKSFEVLVGNSVKRSSSIKLSQKNFPPPLKKKDEFSVRWYHDHVRV